MRTLLLLSATLALPAMEALPYVVTGADATKVQTIRVLDDAPQPSLRYRMDDGPWTMVEVTTRTLPGTSLVISEGTIDDATPGAKITWDDGTTVLGSWRTLRATLDKPLRIATGGDMMHKPELLEATCKVVAKEDPEVAIIGGDWAYDNAEPSNASRWPVLLGTWRATMVRSDGTGVPFIPVIGNHEIKKEVAGTAYEALFPEPTTRAVDLTPQVSLLALNSGHGTPIAAQTGLIADSLKARTDRRWRFAAYHVPAYPSVRKMDDWGCGDIRKLWVPLFEQGGIAACFENHDHARKRTHPLMGGTPTAGGIVYLGDGAWGVEVRPIVPLAERPWIAAAGSDHHAWIIDVGQDEALARAIGPKGELDRVVLKPR